jgi:chromosome segregation ATPase
MRYEQITGPGWNGEPLYVRVETPSDEIPPTEPNTSAMIELIEHLKDKVDALSFELAESTYRLEALHWQKNNLRKKVDELHEELDAQSDAISAKNELIEQLRATSNIKAHNDYLHDRNYELECINEKLREKIGHLEYRLKDAQDDRDYYLGLILGSSNEEALAHREEVLGLKETIMELREKCHHLENELDALEDIS